MPQLMGLFGSAFAANFIDVMLHMDYPITDSLISKQWLTTRLCSPTITNFTKGIRKSPFCYDENMYPVDAGIAFNIPFPPLLTRSINLYIVCDASAGDPESAVTKCEEYAKRHNYLFPSINHKMLYLPKISIFADKNNPYVPVIIYIPHRSKLSFFSFTYDKKDLGDTVATTHDIITDYVHIIKEGIELAIKNQKTIKALMTNPRQKQGINAQS